MKILLVLDQFDNSNNGMTISAQRFAKALEGLGHTVYVVATGENYDKKIAMEELKTLPFADKIIHDQGFTFAKPDDDKLREIIQNMDVVHCYTPFLLSIHAAKIAKELGIPVTAGFHVQPENITATLGLGKVKSVNSAIYKKMNNKFFKYVSHIHCPSKFIADELLKNGYTQKLYIISNGIDPDFKMQRTKKPEEFKDKFIVSMVGRLSKEKRQNLIINAVSNSKHEKDIQIILAGKGPRKKEYIELGKKLTNPLIIDFYKKEELIEMLNYIDLYIHASDMEIEGMSCMEAIACGNVPLIAKSDKSATSQFAMDSKSIFKGSDEKSLTKKINFWFENQELLKQKRPEYAEFSKKYSLASSAKKMEEMFLDAIKKPSK